MTKLKDWLKDLGRKISEVLNGGQLQPAPVPVRVKK